MEEMSGCVMVQHKCRQATELFWISMMWLVRKVHVTAASDGKVQWEIEGKRYRQGRTGTHSILTGKGSAWSVLASRTSLRVSYISSTSTTLFNQPTPPASATRPGDHQISIIRQLHIRLPIILRSSFASESSQLIRIDDSRLICILPVSLSFGTLHLLLLSRSPESDRRQASNHFSR